MWDIIAANQRRSVVLILLMGVLLILLGGVIGLSLDLSFGHRGRVEPSYNYQWDNYSGHAEAPEPGTGPPGFWSQLARGRNGLLIGTGVALLIWFVLWLSAIGAGDEILLNSASAHEIRKEDAPQLWNVVEEMSIAAGLPKMPRVFIIDDAALNAFAVGRRPEKAAVAVTSGLLKRLNRDELQGRHRPRNWPCPQSRHPFHDAGRRNDGRDRPDRRGLPARHVVFRRRPAQLARSGRRRRGDSRHRGRRAGDPRAHRRPAPLSRLLARRREYLADASSARFTRYPAGLAAALEKISGQAAQLHVSKALAPLCIVNPLEGGTAAVNLFSTHPPAAERIRILRQMGGAGLAAYEAAYRQVHGGSERCIPETDAAADEAVAIRAPSAEPDSPDQGIARARAVGDMLDRVTAIPVLACPCGLRMKIPPGFKDEQVTCPRCGKKHPVPRSTGAGSSAGSASGRQATAPPQQYERRDAGWETFQCRCGHTLELSPTFAARQISCPECGARIQVVPARPVG